MVVRIKAMYTARAYLYACTSLVCASRRGVLAGVGMVVRIKAGCARPCGDGGSGTWCVFSGIRRAQHVFCNGNQRMREWIGIGYLWGSVYFSTENNKDTLRQGLHVFCGIFREKLCNCISVVGQRCEYTHA